MFDICFLNSISFIYLIPKAIDNIVSIGNAINDGTSLLRLGDYQVCNMFEPDLFQVSSVNDNYGYLVLYSGSAYVKLDDDTNGYSSVPITISPKVGSIPTKYYKALPFHHI